MKISGFTYIRNGIKLGYPFVQSISSLLPIVDEMIVVVGDSDDGTREAVMRRFPFTIIFRIESNAVRVVRVLHQAREYFNR